MWQNHPGETDSSDGFSLMASRSSEPQAAGADTGAAPAPLPSARYGAVSGALAALEQHRRDTLLESVAAAAKELLRSSDLTVSLPKVAEEIGSATGVDRTHIFLVDGSDGNGQILQHFLWTRSGLPTPAEFKHPSMPLSDVGLGSWIPRLQCGETIAGHTRDFLPEVRPLFELGGIKSTLCVPVFADGQWKGFIGFDDCRSERDWSAAEIGTIKTLAELLGATITTRRHEAILEIVATSARELLWSSDLQQSLPKVMERLGQVTGADRVHIIEFDADNPSAESRVAEHFVWNAPGVRTTSDFRTLKEPMATVGLSAWVPRLARGETVVGDASDFGSAARPLFEKGDVKSVLAVPIFVDGHWRGLISFDACRSERRWGAAEIETFKAVAELVGGAVARMRHLQQLADANRIIESSPTILYRLGPQPPFPLTYMSQNIRHYGYDAGELLAEPNTWLRMIEEEDIPPILANINSLIEGKADHVQLDFRLQKPDGSAIWFDSESYALRDATGTLTAIEGILNDVTERKRKAAEIAALARTDPLTGLPNRVAFLERLALEFARARRGETSFAVHYLDLDHFKDINDTLGHPVGDRLLCVVAERLAASVRATDVVARFGGDEFAVLQDNVDGNASVERLAAKIGAVIGTPYDLDGNQLRTSVSIGIVPYRSDIANIDAMMMKADLALYRAKSDGRNRFRMHVDQLDDETRERMVIGEDLRHAVARNEFELYYQPQIDMTAGEVVGLEALLRWNHPTRGQLLPDAFISVAETTGSITTIGAWVICEACRQIADWRETGLVPPLVAINLSGAQFKLAARLDRIVVDNLARFMVAPDDLELELTESVLLETTERHGEVLTALRRAGVRLAIDDFGTGYSSLDYLRAFQATRLKIDRRFIENVTSNPDNAAITRATIGLAQALGIEVVAEGVETSAQRDFLLEAGCRLAQGFLFGKPMPSAQASTLLPAHHPAAAE